MFDLKKLNEERAELIKLNADLLEGVKVEKRGLTDEENAVFDENRARIEEIDSLIETEKRSQSMETLSKTEIVEERAAAAPDSHKAFADYLRYGTPMETRGTLSGYTGTSAGAIPADYSEDIIRKIVARCDILSKISIVNSRGIYKQIVLNDAKKITAEWVDEGSEITSSDTEFTTLDIGHHKLAALAKVSLELVNQNDFDIETEVLTQMVDSFALKAETAVISGNGSGKPYGLSTSGTAYTTAAASVLKADDIIKIYHTLNSSYQADAKWIMSNDTLGKIRLLKDGDGQYLFHQNELTSGYVGTILGKPVLLTECIDNVEGGKIPIFYGDFARAYKANVNPDMTIQRLDEKYAEYGCIGYVGILWLDGRPVNDEAYVKVTVKS